MNSKLHSIKPNTPLYIKAIIRYSVQILFTICIVNSSLYGQIDDDTFGNSKVKKTDNFDTLQIGKDPSLPDSTIFKSFTLQDISQTEGFTDTTLVGSLYYSDPARDPRYPRANLGNVASASHLLLYKPAMSTGFHTGHHEYDPYHISFENFKYYKTNRAITDLYFSSIANQNNLSVKTNFTRNFSDGIQLSVNYQRYKNRGFYTEQEARTTNLGLGIWYQSSKDKYNFFITYLNNVNTEKQNGGITTDTLFGTENADFKTAIPVNLLDANTRYQQRAIRASNYYNIASPDSAVWNLQLQYDIEYSWNYWNYHDAITNTTTDSAIYQNYLVDPRGARTYISNNYLSQTAYLHGIGPNGYQGKIGLRYNRNIVKQAIRDSTINDLSIKFDVSIPFIKSLQLYSDGTLGLGANAGSFDVDAHVNVNVKKWASLVGGASIFRRSIELIEDQFWVNEVKIFDNDFSKPFGSILYGTLNIPKLKTKVSLHQTIENNPIMWGSNAMPYQFDGLFSITQLSADIHLSWNGLHLENYIQYQIFSNDIIDLPNYASIHKLYWTTNIFNNNMDLKIGLQTRLVPEYTAQRFMPVIGKFHEGVNPLRFYPDTDFFLSYQVQSFRMFFQIQNISDYWNGEKDIDYQVEKYPQYDAKLRYGIRWILFD